MDTIGVVSEPDHPVYSRVGERLAARGFDVQFLPPSRPLDRTAIDALDAFVNTAIRRQSFEALRYADRSGVETWNGFFPTTALSCRLLALDALDRLGCAVPELWLDSPSHPAIRRRRFRWDDPPDGTHDTFYQERVREEPFDYRYYAVDDGIDTHVTAVRIRTHLDEAELALEEADVDVALATRVRELLGRFDARALVVTFVPGADADYAVDVDLAPSFAGTELERRIADSWASLATIGA